MIWLMRKSVKGMGGQATGSVVRGWGLNKGMSVWLSMREMTLSLKLIMLEVPGWRVLLMTVGMTLEMYIMLVDMVMSVWLNMREMTLYMVLEGSVGVSLEVGMREMTECMVLMGVPMEMGMRVVTRCMMVGIAVGVSLGMSVMERMLQNMLMV